MKSKYSEYLQYIYKVQQYKIWKHGFFTSSMAARQTRFLIREKVFIVNLFKTLTNFPNRVERVRRNFARQFLGQKVSSERTIYRLAHKFETKYTVENLYKGNSGPRRTERTDAVVRQVENVVTRDCRVEYDRPANTSRRNELTLYKSTWNRI